MTNLAAWRENAVKSVIILFISPRGEKGGEINNHLSRIYRMSGAKTT